MSEDRSVEIQGIILDVNETLMDLSGLLPVFQAMELDERHLALWFARTLRDGFALSAAGDYRPFGEVAGSALMSLDPQKLTDEHVQMLMQGFRHLQPHPDVSEGLAILANHNIPMCTLSVGNAANVEHLFDAAELSGYVNTHLSVDAVRRWKPSREPYEYACRQINTLPQHTVMIAAHSWDLHGARLAGLKTAWISRLEKTRPEIYPPADFAASNLTTLARELVSRTH